jgi:hypothetical protein
MFLQILSDEIAKTDCGAKFPLSVLKALRDYIVKRPLLLVRLLPETVEVILKAIQPSNLD